jgi:hypothetical protein
VLIFYYLQFSTKPRSQAIVCWQSNVIRKWPVIIAEHKRCNVYFIVIVHVKNIDDSFIRSVVVLQYSNAKYFF